MENFKSDEENSPKSTESIDIAEAQRIEIEQLKKDLGYYKFMLAELKEQNSHKDATSLFNSSKSENFKSSVDLQADLYRFAGMHCVKLDTACVFQFLTGSKVTKNDIYAVEILKIDGHQKLGRWVMPMSIDLQDLVLEYPLENPKNIKPFLKCCKHHIDCYSSRREQYYQLKDFLSNARNCFLDTTLGYLQVHLHMSGIKMIESERIYNVSLYMGYDSDKTFPSKMVTELREGKMLPPEVAPHFSKYFKPFKRHKLREAFEKVINDTRFFQWTKESYHYDEFALFTDGEHDEGEHDEENPDELDETETSRKLYKRKSKERSKKKNVENDPNDDLAGSEGKSSGEKSLSSEEKEERSKPDRNVNGAGARKSVNTENRRQSKRILNSKTRNVDITKYFQSKVKITTEENSNAVEEKETIEKPKENSKEGENSKEWENLKEKENSQERENSKENENSKERENLKENENSKERENLKEKENSKERRHSKEKENSKDRENSKEKENSKERENSKEKENSLDKEDSREKEDEQIERADMINPFDDVKNDNIEILNDGSDRTVDEVEKNAPLNKTTPLSKSNEQIETKPVGRSKKCRGVKKSINRKNNVSNLSTKSIANVDVARNDKELTMIPTNIYRNDFISSTPISSKLQSKLCTSQCSEISEISLSAIAKSRKDHTTVEKDIRDEQIPEEDSISLSISDDIGEVNAYEEAKGLLKDIQSVIEKDEAMKNNIQRKVKKTKKKKRKGA